MNKAALDYDFEMVQILNLFIWIAKKSGVISSQSIATFLLMPTKMM